MEKFIKKAKKNGWEVLPNTRGKFIVYVPFEQAQKQIKYLQKDHNIIIGGNWDFSLKSISFI